MVNLEAYCGGGFEDVRLRFTIEPDSNVVFPGWYIDDISIHQGQVPSPVHNQEKIHTVDEYILFNNYPNPFNAETVIAYQLSAQGHVEIDIFNLLGKKIVTLVNKNQQTGSYQIRWNGKDHFGEIVPSGLYFYKIKTNGFSDCKKMLLIK